MARRRRRKKRLNKKVALIGSAVLTLLAGVIVVALLYVSRDPSKFIEDGDTAVAAQEYELAQRHYREALAVKDPAVQIELLFKLAEVYANLDQWHKVRGAWEGVLLREPGNVKAMLAILQTLYQRADSQTKLGWKTGDVWRDIEQYADKLFAAAEKNGVLSHNTQRWELPWLDSSTQVKALEHMLFGLRGRAAYEQAVIGAVTVPKQTLEKARADFNRMKALVPSDPEAYWYLAKITLAEGELGAADGDSHALQTAVDVADRMLNEGIGACEDSALATLYRLELTLEGYRLTTNEPAPEALVQIEQDYQTLKTRFPQESKIYSDLSKFYWMCCFYRGSAHMAEYLDKAMGAAEQSVQLDPKRVDLTVTLAQLTYRKAAMFGLPDHIPMAIRLAEQALTFPDAQESTGPRGWANKTNRLTIYTFLAHCAIDQILGLDEANTQGRAELLPKAEEAVHQIGQIVGSEDDLEVIKWNGMLDMARGREDQAIRRLYSVYTQMKGSTKRGQRDPLLAYTLANYFKETPEVGMTLECISTALEAGFGFTKPAATLDYLDVLGRMDMWSHVISSVNAHGVDAYEKRFGPSPRSQALRSRALIRTNRLADAQAALTSMAADEPQGLALRLELLFYQVRQIESAKHQTQAKAQSALSLETDASDRTDPTNQAMMDQQLDTYYDEALPLLEQLVALDATLLQDQWIKRLCDRLIQGNRLDRSQLLVQQYCRRFPNNGTIQYYRFLLREADPGALTPQRRRQISEQAIAALSDPVRRAMEQGMMSRRDGDSAQAISHFMTALKQVDMTRHSSGLKQDPAWMAASTALDMALQTQQWDLAQTITDKAAQLNLDRCQGHLFAARLGFAKKEYDQALKAIDTCLQQRPVFSLGYMLRGTIHGARQAHDMAVEDLEKAVSMNPMDPMIAKVHHQMIRNRNQALGPSVTAVQRTQVVRSLERAIGLNPADGSLLMRYADHISETDPFKAVAIYQSMQQKHPTVGHTLALGDLAMSQGTSQANSKRRKVLLDIARKAYEQAYAMAPSNRAVIHGLAQYYRSTGAHDKAEQLLNQSQDGVLLWRDFIRQGKVAEAKGVLDTLYRQQPRDPDILKGMLVVAEMNRDAVALERYFDELIDVEESLEHRFDQMAVLLRLGAIDQAHKRLDVCQQTYPDHPKVTLLQGWLALQQGRPEQALPLIERSLNATHDEHAVAWHLKGDIYARQGDHQLAIVAFRRSVSLTGNSASRAALIRAYLMEQRDQEALSELKALVENAQETVVQRLLGLTPGLTQDPDAALSCYRAQVFTEAYGSTADKKYLRTAISDYESLIQKMPNNIHMLNNLAYLLADNDVQLPAALTHAQKALDLAPRSSVITDTYGFVLYKNGHTAEALKYLSVAIDRFQRANQEVPFLVYEHAALAWEKQGQRTEALQAYRLALNAVTGTAESIRQRLESAVARLSQ